METGGPRFGHPCRQQATCAIREVYGEMSMAAVLNGSHNRDTLTGARMMRIVDLNVELLILGSISLARPASARPGSPAHSVTGPAAITCRCSISACHACSRDLASHAVKDDTPACSRAWRACKCLILDDWGLTPLTAEQRRDLLEIIDDRHGRASTMVTSQLPIDNWHAISAIPRSPTRSSIVSFTAHTG